MLQSYSLFREKRALALTTNLQTHHSEEEYLSLVPKGMINSVSWSISKLFKKILNNKEKLSTLEGHQSRGTFPEFLARLSPEKLVGRGLTSLQREALLPTLQASFLNSHIAALREKIADATTKLDEFINTTEREFSKCADLLCLQPIEITELQIAFGELIDEKIKKILFEFTLTDLKHAKLKEDKRQKFEDKKATDNAIVQITHKQLNDIQAFMKSTKSKPLKSAKVSGNERGQSKQGKPAGLQTSGKGKGNPRK